MSEGLRSRTYKMGLGLLRFIPMILAFIALLNSILSYFDVDLYILDYVGGISVFPMVFLYLSSYMFKFCAYHRMFLHYVVVTWIINITDYYIGIPVNDLEYLCLQMIISGISLFIILYLRVKCGRENFLR